MGQWKIAIEAFFVICTFINNGKGAVSAGYFIENKYTLCVRGGIFNIKKTYIRTYKDVALNNSNGLSDKSIISLYEDDDDKLWIGTDGGGINLYDPHTDQFKEEVFDV